MVKRVSRILLYSLVFFTPFTFVQNTNELFEFPKMYFVYFVGSLLIVLTALERLWVARNCDRKPGFSTFTVLLVVSFIISTAFSTHPYTSVWGYFSRFNGGLISVLIFFGVYWSTKRLQPSIPQFLRIIALTIFPISIYAIMQHFGLGGKWESDTTARAFSTFGQPNWYSAYCAMVLPIILYFGFAGRDRRTASFGWFSLFILGFCGFWYSYSLSGILGLTVSLFLLLALNFDLVKKARLSLTVAFSACMFFTLLNPGMFKQKISDAYTDGEKFIQARFMKPANDTIQIPAVAPLEQRGSDVVVRYEVTDSGFIRKGIWKGALNLASSSPKVFLLGTGPETFPFEFQNFRPASLNYSSEWNYILNKPHNYYLELLTQNGVVGVLLYLAIVIKVLLFRHRILAPALFGLFITNIFSWPTVSTSLLFWVFLALLTADRGDGRSTGFEKLTAPHFKVSFFILLLASVLLMSTYIFLNVRFAKQYLADVANKKSQSYFAQGNVQKALEYTDKSIKLNPYEPYYYRTRAKTYILQTTGQDINTKEPLKALVLGDMLKAQELNPHNLSTLRGLVPLYYFLALKDIGSVANSSSAGDSFDSFYLGIAKNYYKNLSASYPTDVGVLVLAEKYQRMLGLAADHGETVEQIKVLRPDLLDWYLE